MSSQTEMATCRTYSTRLIRSKSGFGLVQVLVALALLSILIMVMLDLIQTSLKQEMNLQRMLQWREFKEEAADIMSSPNCGLVDLGTAAAPKPPFIVAPLAWNSTTTYDLPGGIEGRYGSYKKNFRYEKLYVGDIKIVPYQTQLTDNPQYFTADGATNRDFPGALVIAASLRIDLYSGEELKSYQMKTPILIPIFLTLNGPGGNQIVSCSSNSSKDMKPICDAFDGSWDPVAKHCDTPLCPPGMQEKGEICVIAEGDDTYCKVDEPCGVEEPYKQGNSSF